MRSCGATRPGAKVCIERLRRLNLIGREVAGTISDMQRAIIGATQAKGRCFQKRILALSAIGATVVKKRLAARMAGSHRWRLSHIVAGV